MTGQKNAILRGLSDREVEQSYRSHGDNRLEEKKQKSIWRSFLENFSDPIIRVLLIALVLHIVISLGQVDWFETGGIFVAIFLSTFVSTLSEYGSETAFRKMQQEAGQSQCRVLRGGELKSIPSVDLVRGDVVILSGGEIVPADGIVIDGAGAVNQSALNGESAEVQKVVSSGVYCRNLHQKNLLFRGSIFISGECTMQVSRVGNETLYGEIAKQLQEEKRESPMRRRLNKFAKQISYIGYAAAILVALVYLFGAFVVSSHYNKTEIIRSLSTPSILFPALLHAFTLAITVVVVAVPEGLPMMITVVLSSNMKRMLKDNVLVKKMVGIETAGSMNILFSDKTGTLTTGKMTVDHVVFGDGTVCKSILGIKKHPAHFRYLQLSAYYNTESRLSNSRVLGGNATDKAILSFFASEPSLSATIHRHMPFSSESRMEWVDITAEQRFVILKGAPEVLWPNVEYYLDKDGTQRPLHPKAEAELRRCWHESTSKGERIIMICMAKTCPQSKNQLPPLTFLALMSLKDKVRRDSGEAVAKLQNAGIQVVMITGDQEETAAAIAAECGIYMPSSSQMVMTGAELSKMTDEEIGAILPRIRVVARALPSDKSRLVKIAQSQNLVVGMTGDGVNDAPSLKLADVGFSMGNGTEIAKEASDIVLLDGKMASIVNTVLYGRTIFHSIRKFITFQLMMNLSAVGVSLLGQYIGIETPITIMQMLWINIIMDTLGGLAFAGEPPLSSYLKEKPKNRDENILTGSMLHQILISGGYALAICACFLGLSYFRDIFMFDENPMIFYSSFFLLFIFCGLFNCFNVRTEALNPLLHIHRNATFVLIMAVIAIVQMFIVYFGGTLFRTHPLPFRFLVWILGLGFTVIPVEFVRKILYKLKKR